MVEDLLSRVLRTQPEYDLVVADRLRPEELRAAGPLVDQADFYGILRPRSAASARPLKAIDTSTALLLHTLREPAPLPAFALRALGGGAAAAVARLVADGVLEVEIDGAFASGPRALASLAQSPGPAPASHLSRLSLAALESAAALASAELERIAFHLYAAGRRPLSRSWRERLPDGESVLELLHSGSTEADRLRFEASWRPSFRSERWLHWRSRREGAAPEEEGAATYKLYVSPALEELPGAWSAIVEGLTAGGAFEIKVGANAAGLLRPDKLVAYFTTQSALSAAADRLAGRLRDRAPHGVPFTAEIAGDGLLSWGLDPADDPHDPALGWRSGGAAERSWRHWLALQLARSLVAARADGERGAGAVRFALRRVGLAGVDPGTWTPSELLRRELGGGR